MTNPRAVRIPRTLPPGTARAVRPTVVRTAPPTSGPADVRTNRAGTQRAVRISLVYLGAVAALYLGTLLYDTSRPDLLTPGVTSDLTVFGVVALLLGVVGALLSLGPAPRSVELRPGSIVVVDRWGRRREWSPRGSVHVRVVRRYPAGLLASEPVESVELALAGRRSHYLVTAGLLGEPRER